MRIRQLFLPSLILCSVFCTAERSFEQFLKDSNYDYRIRPKGENGGPIVVQLSILVRKLQEVSEVTMDYSVLLFYRESWIDPRLAGFTNETWYDLHETYMDSIWLPDTYFPNGQSSTYPKRNSVTHKAFLRVNPEGRLLLSRRLGLKLGCDQDLVLFPFDTQTCKMAIESYGYTSDVLRYEWATEKLPSLRLQKVELPDFKVKNAFAMTDNVGFRGTGQYNRLHACFVLERAASFCYLQLIIPSVAVVVTAWVCVWMKSATAFQDLIATFLAIIFLLFSYNEVMPRVSYLKAMDVWLASCFLIIFLLLAKHAFLLFIERKLNDEESSEFVLPVTSNGCAGKDKVAPVFPQKLVNVVSVGLDYRKRFPDEISKKKKVPVFNKFFSRRMINSIHIATQFLFLIVFVFTYCFIFFVFPSIYQGEGDKDCDIDRASAMAVIVE